MADSGIKMIVMKSDSDNSYHFGDGDFIIIKVTMIVKWRHFYDSDSEEKDDSYKR